MHSPHYDSVPKVAATYKYTIWQRLQNLTVAQKKEFWRIVPTLLKKDHRTVENWQYIKKTCNKSVPAEALYQLATFFRCDIKEMWTETPQSLFIERIKIDNKVSL